MNEIADNLALVVVTYNGKEYIDDLMNSINNQSIRPRDIIIVDNSDNLDILNKISASYKEVKIFHQESNLDFAKGYNLAISFCKTEYILIVNQDMILDSNAIKYLLDTIKSDPSVAGVAPKLIRMQDNGNNEQIIDGMGITGNRSRRFINNMEGMKDEKQHTKQYEVFGLSGAAILFRKKALEDISFYKNEFFDNDFIAYQEDIDLSYRIRHKGWKLFIQPNSIIYHKRTAKELKYNKNIIKNRKDKSYRIKAYSYRNHLWLLIKNEPLLNILVDFPFIFFYEFKKLIYILIFEPSTLKILYSFFIKLPKILKERRKILTESKISSKELRYWFK